MGIHIREASNIIIQNVNIKNVKKSGSPTSNGGDAIGMESDVYDIWIDHCTLEASGGEDEGYDGLVDMKDTTQNVTVSYTIFRNSGRGGLIGSGDGDTNNTDITFHHNLYENIDSRTPLLRAGTAHCYNNHYNGIVKSGINPRIGGKAKVENCYFENAQNPLGTFYTTDMGSWEVKDNYFDATVTWKEGDEEFPAGPDPVSTTSISVPYNYALDPTHCVPAIVEANAGVGKI
jgi:pectate lyase